METLRQMASLWNEFLTIGICFGTIGCILVTIMALLVDKLKFISLMVVALPTAICLGISKITLYIAMFLGVIQPALKLL